MNWLAHLVLSSGDPEERLGNWLADVIPLGEATALSPSVARGVELHRRIDSFTDRHPIPLRSRRRFPNGLRRFAGVLVDVAYDHFLSQQFSIWSGGLALAEFTGQVYRQFAELSPMLSGEASLALQRMISEDWLSCYLTMDGYELTLRRISRRLSARAASLFDPAAARRAVEAEYAGLMEDFDGFFPELVAATRPAR